MYIMKKVRLIPVTEDASIIKYKINPVTKEHENVEVIKPPHSIIITYNDRYEKYKDAIVKSLVILINHGIAHKFYTSQFEMIEE